MSFEAAGACCFNEVALASVAQDSSTPLACYRCRNTVLNGRIFRLLPPSRAIQASQPRLTVPMTAVKPGAAQLPPRIKRHQA